MAYSALITLNPIYGLYSSFFPSLVYMLFATSRHLAVGPFAIVSIMIYATVAKLETKYCDLAMIRLNVTNMSASDNQLLLDDVRLKIVTSLSLWCGVFQVLL